LITDVRLSQNRAQESHKTLGKSTRFYNQKIIRWRKSCGGRGRSGSPGLNAMRLLTAEGLGLTLNTPGVDQWN